MDKYEFREITAEKPLIGGEESIVYPLPRHIFDDGDDRVIKIFKPRKVFDGGYSLRRRTSEELEFHADSEFIIGDLLWFGGLNVPRMDIRTSFPTPERGHPLYNDGGRVPAVIMERLRDVSGFSALEPSVRGRALESFTEQLIGAMLLGVEPFDAFYDLNTLYDEDGTAHLIDFSQWNQVRMPGGSAVQYLRRDGVLPSNVWNARMAAF